MTIDTFEMSGGELFLQFSILVSIKILAPFNKWSGTRSFRKSGASELENRRIL
jgi:hypothetical protein